MSRSSMSSALRGAALAAAVVLASCAKEPEPDAYGNFEATEVVVSAQTGGQIERFEPVEGMRLAAGTVAVVVDTTQLSLQRAQLVAQRAATGARRTEVSRQMQVLEVQRDIALRAYERTRRLHDVQAATAQQLDQAERDYRTLVAQIEAQRAQLAGVRLDVASSAARVEQVGERISVSSVVNPRTGTVLTTYVRAGEVVQPGQPLYRIADLDTLVLRAYVTGGQLGSISPGQAVQVHVAQGPDALRSFAGTVGWISPSAEFTPTPVQTRDDRADLVYAVKIRVPNHDGFLKIGMPADVTFGAGPSGAPAPPATGRQPR